MHYTSEWNDDFDDTDNEYDFDDAYDSDDLDLVACPNCGEDIPEDVDRCIYCGDYVTHSTSAFAGKPVMWVILGVLGITSLLYSLLFGF